MKDFGQLIVKNRQQKISKKLKSFEFKNTLKRDTRKTGSV